MSFFYDYWNLPETLFLRHHWFGVLTLLGIALILSGLWMLRTNR